MVLCLKAKWRASVDGDDSRGGRGKGSRGAGKGGGKYEKSGRVKVSAGGRGGQSGGNTKKRGR